MNLYHLLLLAPAILMLVRAFAKPGSAFAPSKPLPDAVSFRVFAVGFALIGVGVSTSILRQPYLNYAFIAVVVVTMALRLIRRRSSTPAP